MGPVTFLLVEDDEVDIQAMRRVFARMKLTNALLVAGDGIEAMDLPRMGGIEFLDELRADPVLTTAIVFVLTTSAEERDRFAAYTHHVAGYIVKRDLSGDGLLNAIEMLDRYWRVVELP